MTPLYTCRHDGDQYRISKWLDGDVESSYLCTETECECPAGHRPMCRHREMLPLFISRGAVNRGEAYDYERGGWVRMFADEDLPSSEPEPMPKTTEPALTNALERIMSSDFGKPSTIPDLALELPDSDLPHSQAVTTADFDSANTGSNPVGVASRPAWRRF